MALMSLNSLEEQFLEVSLEESPPTSSHLDEIDCDFCGKNYDPSDIQVVPEIIGDIYRLEFKSSGCFCCSETGIKFEVTRPVTIEYELDSWNNYKKHLSLKGSEVLGPLFKVTTPLPPDTVSAVHLPHCLCLKKFKGDKSWIRCAHFKDGNLSVETPTRILPFHVVLENPSFSSLGILLLMWNLIPTCVSKHIPIHGKVLLYFQVVGVDSVEYKLHLYLMPSFASVKEVFDQNKTSEGFSKLDKSPKTKIVYIERNYTVKAPEGAHITNEEMQVECGNPLEIFSEIIIAAAVQPIDLWLEEDAEQKIWECRLSKGELEQFLLKFKQRSASQGRPEELQTEIAQHTRPQDSSVSGREAKPVPVDEPRINRHELLLKHKQTTMQQQNQLSSEDHRDEQVFKDAFIQWLGSKRNFQKFCESLGPMTYQEICEEVERVRISQDRHYNDRKKTQDGMTRIILEETENGSDDENEKGSDYEILLYNESNESTIRSHTTTQDPMEEPNRISRDSRDLNRGSNVESDETPKKTDSKPVASSSSAPKPRVASFVDNHREALITRIPHVAPVLDGLLSKELLTPEENDAILAERTPQDRMRKLYVCMRQWSESHKHTLYEILKEKNRPLIEDLEQS